MKIYKVSIAGETCKPLKDGESVRIDFRSVLAL